MTKYILHGGNTRDRNTDNNNFFRSMTEGLNGEIKILLVYFAREDDISDDFVLEDKERFTQSSENKHMKFEVANQDTFIEQVKSCNVIYIRGGSMRPLHEKLPLDINYKEVFEGKVVGGSSAGCYILSKCYWSESNRKFVEGLGVLDIISICHYTPSENEIFEKTTILNLPLIALPDYKSISIVTSQ